MRFYLKATCRAAIKALRDDDCEDFDRAVSENEAVIRSAFDGLMNGQYDYAFIRRNNAVTLYTRSAKTDGVQLTAFWDRDGELIPLSDGQYRDAESWISDGYPDGCYLNVSVA